MFLIERGRDSRGRKTRPLFFLAVALGGLALSGPVLSAGSVTAFSVSPSALSFPSAGPSTPSISATGNPVTISLQTSGATNWVITVSAGGDLTSGSTTIPISNITWTSGSPGFNSTGTLSKSSSVTVAAGSGDVSGSGTLSFALANRWTYPTGTFSQTLIFTSLAL